MLLTNFPTGIDIPELLILDKANQTSILFRYYSLIFTKLEKKQPHTDVEPLPESLG